MDLGAFSISLAVEDLEASRTFYEKFGFEVVGGDASQNWQILRNGDHTIGLFQGMFERNILTFNPGWDGKGEALDTFTDVRELQRRLKAKGVQLVSEADENGTGPASAVASVNSDGSVSLVEGSPDIGGNRVALAMQFAEVLGIAAEDVKPAVGDTDSVGFTSNTGGSGATFKSGWACYEAAQDIKRQFIERASKIWETSPEDVEYTDGALTHKSDPELKLTFKQLAARLNGTGGPISGRGNVNPRGQGPAVAGCIVDVEVDPDTGKVEILRCTVLQDVGKAIHPSYVEGQMQGGAAQGIGWALNEEYVYNARGEMTNSSFLDYRMPTSLDLPMIDTVVVEVPNPGHPFGMKGVGEVAIVPPMPAIANAIYNAIGVRMSSLPMSPGNVLEAIWEQQKNGE